MTSILLLALIPLVASSVIADGSPRKDDDPIAEISLYNPTAYAGPIMAEVPIGRIAAPSVVNWRKVHLTDGSKEIPFSIREGRAHWNAALKASDAPVRAEDILVLSCKVAPNTWKRIQVHPGHRPSKSAISRIKKTVTVSYPNVRLVVDDNTGALLHFKALGEEMLEASFLPTVHKLGGKGYELQGEFGPGYQAASVVTEAGEAVPARARMVSKSSTASMTELNYVIEPAEGPSLALTYRLHSFGLLEIAVDERPWQGKSPWLDHIARTQLSLRGAARSLPLLEGRPPLYGFKDYSSSTRLISSLHQTTKAGLLQMGDGTINSRRFFRQLFVIKAGEKMDDLVEIANEGLVVDIKPAHKLIKGAAIVDASPQSPLPAAKLIRDALKSAGVDVVEQAGSGSILRVDLGIAEGSEANGLSGDGFSVTTDPKGGVKVRARTRLGLYLAARAIARHLHRLGGDGGVPLVARNPVVDLRAGGFGGGPQEVDFPYGTEKDWQQVFDNLLDSGMNVFTCLGMWGNWKMPISYKHMAELRSSDPNAYDESSGTRFSEIDAKREHGLRLARYLQERGADVWLWIPIGCVPTTFAERFPEAMAPGSSKTPCFTHPQYTKYVDAYLRELVETYSIQGLVLIRDDNGGICTCDRCKDYIAKSRTKSQVWEQSLIIYDRLRALDFSGTVAVYPYFDTYQPAIDPLLPEDLCVLGHGSGTALLTRSYKHIGPMGDTWLDNLYGNFRLASTPRMRRLLCDRGSFWIGGAYCGTELPWEAIGYFGWEPTATANSFRHDWGLREMSKDGALPFLRLNERYDHLWDLMEMPMIPAGWMKMPVEERRQVVKDAESTVEQFRSRLTELKRTAPVERHSEWFKHMELYTAYFEYHLYRLDKLAAIQDLVHKNKDALNSPGGLPSDVRNTILKDYSDIYAWAGKYDVLMKQATARMLVDSRHMTSPYKELMAGYDQYLESTLDIRQFAGSASMETVPQPLQAGQPFVLKIDLHNQGICPWVVGATHRLELFGAAEKLGLPASWEFEGESIAPGDHRIIEFRGTAPVEPGEGEVSMGFLSPFRWPERFITCKLNVAWK